MKLYKKLGFSGALCATLLCVGCTSDDNVGEHQPKGLMPVLFSAGNMDATITRAASAAYMPDSTKFACAMFFHAGASDTNDSTYATPVQEVNMFSDVFTINGNQGEAKRADDKFFYWQNRLNHVFLAVADNNSLTKAPVVKVGEKVTYDLTRGEETAMTQQPDPMVAHVMIPPAGATPEANRVKLYFKHQFAQIQVNIKSSQDQSADVSEDQIRKVELVDVAQKVSIPFAIESNGNASALEVSDDPQDFEMFTCDTPVSGYIKSFEAIAYGTLKTIRITWEEKDKATDGEAIVHTAELKSVDNVTLQSGHRYIYNIELRRTVIAQISAEIEDWTEDTTRHTANGTIIDD